MVLGRVVGESAAMAKLWKDYGWSSISIDELGDTLSDDFPNKPPFVREHGSECTISHDLLHNLHHSYLH